MESIENITGASMHPISQEGIESPLQHMVDEETISLSGIHKIPPEILITIFEYHLQGKIPRLGLAMVCKLWKAVLLKTPGLWCNIECQSASERSMDPFTLQQRIELSRSVPLDVKLSLNHQELDSASIHLFRLVADTGMERWRSLTLRDRRRSSSPETFIGIFRGSLTNLRCLSVKYRNPVNAFTVLEESLIKAMPLVEDLDLRFDAIPRSWQDGQASLFQNVKVLMVQPSTFKSPLQFPSLQTITVDDPNHKGPINISSKFLPPLPRMVHFKRIRQSQLATFELENIHSLTIDHLELEDGDYYDTILLSNLLSLVIRYDFHCLEGLMTPKLQRLDLMAGGESIDKEFTKSHEAALLNIHVRPLHFTLDWGTHLPFRDLYLVFQQWPQLQHLRLTFWRDQWSDEVTNAFKNPSTCPSLKSLHMGIWLGASLGEKALEQFARETLELRKGIPMEMIAWRDPFMITDYSGWMEYSIRDLDG